MDAHRLPGMFFGPPTLIDLVRHRARHQGDDIAFTFLVDGENEQIHLTNGQLDRQARAIAAWLQSSGLAGERALLLYPAGLEFVAAFFGCIYAGVVAVPVYPPRRNRSLSRIQAVADDADAKVALTNDVVLRRVKSLIDETPRLKSLDWLSTSRTPSGLEQKWENPDVKGRDTAFLQYTSGSTGTPKGVMLSHANLIHNSAVIAYAFEHTRSGLGVFWLPSYHDMGLIGGILQPLFVGRPNVLMAPMAFLQKPFRWLSAISRFGGTTSGGPNFAYDLCVRKIKPEQRKTLDLSSWQVAFNGAEPVREETLERFAEMFEPCGFRREAFYPCFGLAEATLMVSGGYACRPPVSRCFDGAQLAAGRAIPAGNGETVRTLVGCGSAMPDQQLAIVDPETCTRCEDGCIGEIWAGGPSIAQGYWRKDDATKETFQARLSDTGEGPFLRTGDLGFLSNGELFVTGRIKDLIILRGANLYPQDIEETVQKSHSWLRPNAGAAFTVERDGREQLVIVQELLGRKGNDFEPVFDAICRAVSAEHEMTVDAIVLVKHRDIPRTSSGKIQRHACRKQYLEDSFSIVARWQAGPRHVSPTARPSKSNGKAARPTRARPEQPLPIDTRAAEPTSDGNGTGKMSITAEVVLDEVRKVACERADGLTLNSLITEIGLDSLERMEILASIEERFGGRFPEEILPELETCRQLVEAVQQYLGTEPRPQTTRPANVEIPEQCFRFDQFPEYLKLKQDLGMAESSGLGNPFFTVHQGLTSDHTIIDRKEYINFSSYDYLGMSGDPVVVRAAQDAVAKYGASVSASRLVSGEKDLHGRLEKTIARFVGTEDAVVFVSGHATNETVVGHLLGPGDLILHDALSHNSILQGCILSGARRRPFPHNNWRAADELLRQYRHEYRRVLIIIEGVYSMDGDIPDLPKFIEVKKRHKALLMIDEAHSIGVLGEHGRGISEYFGIDSAEVDVCMGTLSKSFGSCGGYIAGCKELVEYLKYTTPGFVFSVGLSPPSTAAAMASIELLEAEPQRAARLRQRSGLFLELAKENGLDTGMSNDSPVVPVILHNSLRCVELSKALFARGVNVQPIVHPAVPENAARLRFFLTSQHTEDQIRFTIDAMVGELRKMDGASAVPAPVTAAVVDSMQPA